MIAGNNGGKCAKICSHEIIIPSSVTARIQEMQMILGHLIIELVEKKIKYLNIFYERKNKINC